MTILPTLRKVVLLSLVISCGCVAPESTVPFTNNSQDTTAYALTVKQAVSDQVTVAMTSSEPADQLAALASMLELSENRPQGEHEPIYLEILAAAQKLSQECAAANGKPKGLAESLNALKAIADKLPGTVVDSKPRKD